MRKCFITKQKSLYSYTDFELGELIDVKKFLESCKKDKLDVCLDIETTGLDVFTSDILSIQIGNKKLNEFYIIDCTTHSKKEIREALQLLSELVVIVHNLKFEYKFLLNVLLLEIVEGYCTMLVEQCIWNNHNISKEKGFYSLKGLVKRYCNKELDKTEQTSFINFNGTFTESQLNYALEDVVDLEEVKEKQQIFIDKLNLNNLIQLENKVCLCYGDIELNGIGFNEFLWIDTYTENKKKLNEVVEKLDDYIISNSPSFPALKKYIKACIQQDLFGGEGDNKKTTINWGSDKQVKEIFAVMVPHLDLKYYDIKKKEYRISVGAPQIEQYKDQFDLIPLYLEYQEYSTAMDSFGLHWLDNVHHQTDRIHTEFNQLRAKTGRVSSSSLKDDKKKTKGCNLQQIPSDQKYRRAFVSREGYKFVGADYSQAEIRIVANNSGEEKWCEALNKGEDPYCAAATEGFGILVTKTNENKELRKPAKFIILGTNYGASDEKLSKQSGIPLIKMKELLARFKKGLPKLDAYLKRNNEFAKKNRYAVTHDIFARRCWFDDSKDLNTTQLSQIGRNGQNHPIQGGNANLTKLATIFVRKYFKELNKQHRESIAIIVNQVHDEINFEVKEEFAEEVAVKVRELMIKAGTYICKKVIMDATYVIDDCWIKD
jgi:DNA polymerase-1